MFRYKQLALNAKVWFILFNSRQPYTPMQPAPGIPYCILRKVAFGLLVLCMVALALRVKGQSLSVSPQPCQDCPGASWVTKSETILNMGALAGPGRIANELPTSANTCLASNERRTIWLMFKIFGADTTEVLGRPAGNLHFTIEPEDTWNLPVTADSGREAIGNTDYDFALFDVTSFAYQADACQAIRRSAAVGQPNSVQLACNYSGLPGTTGMVPSGKTHSADGERYCLPTAVRTGQVLMLAIDNFSLNATRFRLRFLTSGGVRVVPAGSPTITMHTTPSESCTQGLTLHFSKPLPIDSLAALTPAGARLAPTGPPNLQQAYTRYQLEYATSADTQTLALRTQLADRYQRTAQVQVQAQLLPPPPKPEFIQVGNHIGLMNTPADAQPLWYRNDTLLPETSTILDADQPGRYQVRFQRGPCLGPLSATILHGLTGLVGSVSSEIHVYPQPAHGQLSVQANTPIAQVTLFALSGAVVQAPVHISGSTAQINTGQLAAGIYVLHTQTSAGVRRQRVTLSH